MRPRWSLFARISAIVALGLFVVQLLLVALYVTNRGPGALPGYRFPLPERILAMAQVLEEAPDPAAAIVALNSEEVVVFLDERPIAEFEAEDLRLPEVEAVLADYAARLGERRFAAFIAPPDWLSPANLRMGDRTLWSRYPLRVAVELRTGPTLVVESRGDLVTKIYSLPVGFFAGVIAVIAAIVMLVALRRETRPLVELARAAEAFGGDGTPRHVAPRGAADLRELIARFNRMQEQVHELLTARTVMLGALGHDLRTYLTRMRLRIDTLPEEARAALERDIETMSDVLESCLILSRSEASAEREAIELGAYLAAFAAERGPEVSFFADSEGPVTVAFDRAALERILANLTDNALKFGDRCEIGLAADGDRAVVTVTDDGPGMDDDAIAAAFEPFRRGDTARTLDRGGAGLGLAIVRMLAERNGAKVALGRASPRGLVAELRIPLAAQPGKGPER